MTRGGGLAAAFVVGVVLFGLGLLWLNRGPEVPDVVHEQDPQVTFEPVPRLDGEGPSGVALPPQIPLAERAAQLAGAEGVVCRIEPRLEGGTARLLLDGDPGLWLAVAAAQADVLVLSEIPESGSGTVLVEGFAPTPVTWADARGGRGRCTPDPLVLAPAQAAVVGTVRGAGRGAVALSACGQRVQPDGDGDFYAAAVPGEPCSVVAKRHYGVWEWQQEEEVVPRTDRDAVVELDSPEFDAVLPLVIEDGVVRAVWEVDLPRNIAGARVRTVDGEPVPGDADGFHLATGGAPGEVALVEVDLEDGTETISVPRKRLGFEDWLAR